MKALVLALALVAAPAAISAQFPTDPPPPAPLRPAQFPPFREARLGNGLQLILVENHELPIVSVSLAMHAGSRYEPQGREGLAELMAELLTKGTRTRTAEQIAEQIEGVGSSLGASAGSDLLTVSTTVLTDHLDLAFTLLSDVLLNSTYPQAEFDLAMQRMLSNLQLEKSSPETLAGRFFAQGIYGDHPYGRSVTETSLGGVTRQAVAEHAATWLKPGAAFVVIAGDLSLADARRFLDRYLGAWRGAAPARPTEPAPPPLRATEVVLVHRPGSAQSNIAVGNLGLGPRDPAYFAITVGNKILGQGADSRLFRILREERSWTYGASSGVTRRLGPGYFSAGTETRNPVTDSALVELIAQLKRIRTEPVADSELTAAKGYLVGSFPRTIETPQQIASQVSTVKLLGLGDDYLRTYRERLAAVTQPDILEAARRVIKPDSAVIVVVGDGQAIYEKLRPVAPVRIIDIDGKPITADDLRPKAGPLAFDRAHLVARRDSFQVSVQGQPFGHMVAEVRPGSDSIVYLEETEIPAIGLHQTATVVLDPGSLAVRSVHQNIRGAGQTAETRLTYAQGRVRGRAQTPDPRAGAPKTAEVDTAVAAGTIDLNAFQPLVALLPLAENASFTVGAFDASENTVRTLTIKVSGAVDVTVPAGTFPAFRVEVSGTPQPLVFFVSRAAPRRLLKIELVGQPLSFELVK